MNCRASWIVPSLLAVGLSLGTGVSRQSSPPAAQPDVTQYVGKLDHDLVPTPTFGMEKPMATASEAERKALPVRPAPTDQVLIGSLAVWSSKGLRLAFVRPASGSAYLYADTNSNGVFEKSERHPLLPFPDSDVEGIVMLYHPLSAGLFSRYPIRIAIMKPDKGTGSVRPASSMGMVFAQGKVNMDGRQVPVTYLFDLTKGTVDPDYGWLGIDCNLDGKIDQVPTSPEYQFAKHQVVVFRVGEHYVSTQSVDVRSGRIVLRVHPATAYTNIELKLGKEITDCPFTDFDGKQRNLTELRGKYVLLDFWATWCAPCVAEIPFLKSAYERFKERNLEILGIDNDEDLAAARKLAAERGVTWPQATLESIRGRLTVYAFPTTILLDPAGRIVSMGAGEELRGQNLERTLDKLLPPKRPIE
jgi:thiol-disulfide isomerase/thioredoxin